MTMSNVMKVPTTFLFTRATTPRLGHCHRHFHFEFGLSSITNLTQALTATSTSRWQIADRRSQCNEKWTYFHATWKFSFTFKSLIKIFNRCNKLANTFPMPRPFLANTRCQRPACLELVMIIRLLGCISVHFQFHFHFDFHFHVQVHVRAHVEKQFSLEWQQAAGSSQVKSPGVSLMKAAKWKPHTLLPKPNAVVEPQRKGSARTWENVLTFGLWLIELWHFHRLLIFQQAENVQGCRRNL